MWHSPEQGRTPLYQHRCSLLGFLSGHSPESVWWLWCRSRRQRVRWHGFSCIWSESFATFQWRNEGWGGWLPLWVGASGGWRGEGGRRRRGRKEEKGGKEGGRRHGEKEGRKRRRGGGGKSEGADRLNHGVNKPTKGVIITRKSVDIIIAQRWSHPVRKTTLLIGLHYPKQINCTGRTKWARRYDTVRPIDRAITIRLGQAGIDVGTYT